MCSYYSPRYLLPPHDLIQLAVCAREWNNAAVVVLDAIAETLTEADTHARIAYECPDMIVAVVGIETYGEDMACLDRIKAAYPATVLAVFGYYPTFFAAETLRKSAVDLVLLCEPEMPLSNYLKAVARGEAFADIPGLAYRRDDGAVQVNPEQRLESLDDLPFPDYGLVDGARYEEAFLGGPCGAVLSSRGCPFACTYCTTTYGRRMVMKSPATVVAEMRHLKDAGIRFVRFLDDTFTFDKKRVLALCQALVEAQVPLPWSCLSRVDTLDAEMLAWMKRAGCKRVLIGIESYSQKVLAYLNKRVAPDTINKQLALIRDAGIEVIGFFLIGAPIESEEDFQETLRGALAAPLDFLAVNIMTPYAATPYFEQAADEIEFNLLPYHCAFKDPHIEAVARLRSHQLYRRFYLRPSVVIRKFHYVLRNPLRVIQLLWTFIR